MTNQSRLLEVYIEHSEEISVQKVTDLITLYKKYYHKVRLSDQLQ